MIYSAYKLNKQSDNIQPWSTVLPIWNQSVVPCAVLTVASLPAYRFLRGQVRRSDILISLRIFHSWVAQTKGLDFWVLIKPGSTQHSVTSDYTLPSTWLPGSSSSWPEFPCQGAGLGSVTSLQEDALLGATWTSGTDTLACCLSLRRGRQGQAHCTGLEKLQGGARSRGSRGWLKSHTSYPSGDLG